MRRACNYVRVGQLLPDVLDELHYHVAAAADEAAERLALQALVEACVCATFTAKNLNYTDLAHLAALRAEEAAACLSDPIYKGKADFVWLHTLPRAGSWDRNLIAAERAADDAPTARQRPARPAGARHDHADRIAGRCLDCSAATRHSTG